MPGNIEEQPLRTLNRLAGDFKQIDLDKIEQASELINRLERQIPEWGNPSKFEGLYKNLQENLQEINQNLQWDPKASDLEKILITQQAYKLADTILDKSIKALTSSSLYTDDMKDPQGNHLKAARVKKMLHPFLGLLEVCAENAGYQEADQIRVKQRLSAIREFLQKKESAKENAILTKAELSPSPNFAVNRATIKISGDTLNPTTLEDCFTLIHQNILVALNDASKDINQVMEKQYPPLVKLLNEKFDKEMVGDNNEKITPSSTLELNADQFIITKNLPLRQHSSIAEIKYTPKTDITSVKFSIFGENIKNRWDHVVLDNYLYLTAADCNFISKPYFDEQKDIVSFEVKVEDASQAEAVIKEINQAIEKSFQFVFQVRGEKYLTTLLKNRVSLLETLSNEKPELQTEFDKLNVFLPLPITWKLQT